MPSTFKPCQVVSDFFGIHQSFIEASYVKLFMGESRVVSLRDNESPYFVNTASGQNIPVVSIAKIEWLGYQPNKTIELAVVPDGTFMGEIKLMLGYEWMKMAYPMSLRIRSL